MSSRRDRGAARPARVRARDAGDRPRGRRTSASSGSRPRRSSCSSSRPSPAPTSSSRRSVDADGARRKAPCSTRSTRRCTRALVERAGPRARLPLHARARPARGRRAALGLTHGRAAPPGRRGARARRRPAGADGRARGARATTTRRPRRSATSGGPSRYNLLAAESALSALAFDEASRRFRAALELGLEDPARARGRPARASATRVTGRATPRRRCDAFREAAAIARDLRDDELLARAAIGFEETCWRPAIHDAGARRAARGGRTRRSRRTTRRSARGSSAASRAR